MIRHLLLTSLALAPVPALAADYTCVSTDNAPAINGLFPNRKVVSIGPGDCPVASAIVVPTGVTLAGAGPDKTVLRAMKGDSFNVIEVGSAGGKIPLTGIDISGLSIDGAATGGDLIPMHSDGIIVFARASHVLLHNLGVYHAGDNGVQIIGSNDTIEGSTIGWNQHNGIMVSGTGNTAKDAIPADHDSVVGNMVVSNSLAVAPVAATIKATGVKSWDNIDLDPIHSNAIVEGNTVFGDDILDHDAGKVVTSSGGDQISNNIIVGSKVSAIDISDYVSNVLVTSNQIWSCFDNAIVVGGPVSGVTISGNWVFGSGPITVHKDATAVSLVDNVVSAK